MHNIKKLIFKIFDPFGEEYRDITNGIAMGFLSVAWFFILITTIERIKEYDPITLIRVLTLIGATLGVYVAIWKQFSDHRWRHSEVYLEQAKGLFEKSYNSLQIDEETGYPKNSRNLWLSSSRLLLAALAIGDKITETSHKETFKEYIEYWRIQFRELLDFDGERSPQENYFFEKGCLYSWSDRCRAPIAERSIAVIHRFMQWPENITDRLHLETDFTDEELEKIRKFGSSGIASYCNRKRNPPSSS